MMMVVVVVEEEGEEELEQAEGLEALNKKDRDFDYYDAKTETWERLRR